MSCAGRGLAPFGDILGGSSMLTSGPFQGSAANAALNPFAGDGQGSAFQPDFFGVPQRPMGMDLPVMGSSLFGAPNYPVSAAPSAAAPMLSQQQNQTQQQLGLSTSLPSFTEAPAPQPISGGPTAVPADTHGFAVSSVLSQCQKWRRHPICRVHIWRGALPGRLCSPRAWLHHGLLTTLGPFAGARGGDQEGQEGEAPGRDTRGARSTEAGQEDEEGSEEGSRGWRATKHERAAEPVMLCM